MVPCIVNIFKQDQQDATLHNGIYYYKCSTCFRRFRRPSSGAQNCIHSIGYLSSFFCFLKAIVGKLKLQFQLTHDSGKKQKKFDKDPMLWIQFWAPDDGRKNRLKHVSRILWPICPWGIPHPQCLLISSFYPNSDGPNDFVRLLRQN